MGTPPAVCISCAYFIGGNEIWSQRFRAIYLTPDEVQLSGIGFRKSLGGRFLVPTDETARWDTMGDDFIQLFGWHKDNQKKAFVFHDTCWGLLREHFDNKSIPLERLFDVCRFRPPRTINENVRTYRRQDPSKIVGTQNLLRPAKDRSRPCHGVGYFREIVKNENEFFERFPPEIREEIVAYLPTADFYNIRYVSRVMAALFSSQAFWATRFEVTGDRGFLSYLKARPRDGKASQEDWQLLYHCTNETNICYGLENRKRVWAMNRWLKDTTSMTAAPSPSKMSRNDLDMASLVWKEAQGDFRSDDDLPVPHPSRYIDISHRQLVYIHRPLAKVALSIIQEMEETYITGIELIFGNTKISMGYEVPGKQVTIDVKSLRGFEIAVGSRGIRALRLVTDSNSTLSQWLGRPDGACTTTRLILQEDAPNSEIIALDAAFDQYKMISLAIGSHCLSTQKETAPRNDHLRKNALWDPKMPESDLFLNEGSFMGEDPLTPGYRPLHWTLFGGRDGRDLRSLTGISVDLFDNQPFIMNFFYKEEKTPKICLNLGDHPSTGHWSGTKTFSIDGPGGEVIEAVDVAVQYHPDESGYRHFRHGVPRYYKISTNFGRCCSFRENETPELEEEKEQASLKTLETAPGTTLIGFYAAKHYEYGIISLGVISAAI